LADRLRAAGLRIWIDERRIEDLTSIQAAIAEGLTHAKALLAWYSPAYPESRPCQWEFTTAFLTALAAGQALERILRLCCVISFRARFSYPRWALGGQ
jgi:hypothetical protein